MYHVVFNATLSHLDECEAGFIKCSDNALCKDIDINVNGTANCTCKEGYTGNGSSCDGK